MFLKKEKDPTRRFDLLRKRKQSPQTLQKTASRTTKVKLTPKKVRPIQMGDFLWKYVSRQLLALSEGEIAALTAAQRQLGFGFQGAEAPAIFHQLIFDE